VFLKKKYKYTRKVRTPKLVRIKVSRGRLRQIFVYGREKMYQINNIDIINYKDGNWIFFTLYIGGVNLID